MWIPNEMDLKQLLTLLSDSFSSDNVIQRRVYITLKNFESRPDFYRYLLFIILSMKNQIDINVFSMALNILKNNIKYIYNSLGDEVQTEVKELVVCLLTDQDPQLQFFGGNILAEIACHDNMYTRSVLPHLRRLIENHTPSTQSVYFRLLEKICEDISEISSPDDTSLEATVTSIVCFLFGQLTPLQDDYHNYWVLKCINRLIPFFSRVIFSQNFNFMDNLVVFVNRVDCSTSTAIMVLSTICDVMYENVSSKFHHVAQNLIDYITSNDYDLAYQSSEFWVCFFDHAESEQMIVPYLPQLVSNLLCGMCYTEHDSLFVQHKDNCDDMSDSMINPARNDSEGEDEDADEDTHYFEWTLRKSCGYSMDRIGQIFRSRVLSHLGSLLNLLNDSNWMKNESGVLAIGAIAKGCESCATEYYPHVFDILLKFLEHYHLLVRSITCWTLSRHHEFYNQSDRTFFDRMVVKILVCFTDPSSHVQSSAVSAISKLVDNCGFLLCDYNDVIARKIVECLGFYQSQNLKELYEFIGRCSRFLPNFSSNSIFTQQIIPTCLNRLTITNTEYEIIDIFLLDMLGQIAYSPGYVLLPYAESLLKYCGSIIDQTLHQIEASTVNSSINPPDKEFMFASIDFIDSLSTNYQDRVRGLFLNSNLINLLKSCLNTGDSRMKFLAATCFGAISKYNFDCILHQLNDIYQLLMNFEGEDSCMTITNCLWTSQIFILNLKSESSKYVSLIMESILKLLRSSYVSQKLGENICSNISYLTRFCEELVRPYTKEIVEYCIPFLLKDQNLKDRYDNCLTFLILLRDNPEAFAHNLIQIYNLVCSFHHADECFRFIFVQMINSNQQKISPQEWQNLHSQINLHVREKLQTLVG
ncbi:Transportin-1 [Thelohanellus kitauei]|uniref:Transportin-1 n=1 Tax=Thelohanellus kitauei TaxID=669202 RepID=A0A0C2IWI9_THEKT|nr:Transportin-1 [Thelohanellus kitauei]